MHEHRTADGVDPLRRLATSVAEPAPDALPNGPVASTRSGGRRRLALPVAISVLVAIGALAPTTPLVDATTGAPAIGAALHRPAAYVAVAPISDTLDALTCFSLAQHAALGVSAAALFMAWGIARAVRGRSLTLERGLRVAAHGTAVVCMAYLALTLLPRPMAGVYTADPDVVVIDFHSHTAASHDGRSAFDAGANRLWHHKAGFDVAYVSDHQSVRGAIAGLRTNPAGGASGTILLPALEARDGGEHVIALGIDPSHVDLSTANWLPTGDKGSPSRTDAPFLLLTLPGALPRLRALASGSTPIGGLEIADASPRGIGQGHQQRDELLRLADSLDVAVVAGSDNHGWGRAAAAWSLVRLPGWRQLPPAELDRRIRAAILRLRRGAVVVIERRTAPSRTAVQLALTVPLTALLVARTMGRSERVAWLGWVWAWPLAAIIRAGVRQRRAAQADGDGTDAPSLASAA